MGAARVYTSALHYEGDPPQVATTESWNGTNWTNENSMSTARHSLGSAGTLTNALAFGGAAPSDSAATEEWNNDATTTQTID